MSDDKIIPFGKYKGQKVEVLLNDPQYVQWMLRNGVISEEKNQPIYQVVINNFAPPSEDTPEHNALQVRFLEDEYRAAFWQLAELVKRTEDEYLWRSFRENTRHLRHAPEPCVYRKYIRQRRDEAWMRTNLEQHRRSVRQQWAVWRIVRTLAPPVFEFIGAPRFEGVTDVVFSVNRKIGNKALERMGLAAVQNYRLGIEIKPSVGDDYPAVLRQMKQQKNRPVEDRPSHWFLLIDQFTATNVTLDQVRSIFALDDIRIVLISELP